jgi:hypothetical protein
VLVATALAVSAGAPTAGATTMGVPYPDLAKFLPSGYHVSAASFERLTPSGSPQFVVSASGPPPKALTARDQGWLTSTLLLLVWDSPSRTWRVAFNAAAQPDYEASSNAGATGPGLVLAGHRGPSFAVLHDEPGDVSDLEYWLDTVGGNSEILLLGIVHYTHTRADLAWFTTGEFAHPQLAPPSVQVVGAAPHQRLRVTAPWVTSVDNRSFAVRMYHYFVAQTALNARGPQYAVVNDDQSWVGVGLVYGKREPAGLVGYVCQHAPASRVLRKGDEILDVRGAKPAVAWGLAVDIPVVDQVAHFYPGGTIRLDVVRQGRHIVVPVTLGEWPLNGNPLPASADDLLPM